MVLRVATDLAENNKGVRVVGELICVTFRVFNEEHLDNLVGSATFGDGAACLIIGSDPESEIEKPHFEIQSGETILPESDGVIDGQLGLGHSGRGGKTFILKDRETEGHERCAL
ncbi:hypothetical protein R1sor_015155 [Riccia sorocarpa]|uniref:Chalcone/stilbene synthase N-terminal domain-containing protein n=1 Tax=Riccia sorocarpa TaxID=122646 RepID=A0ABD3HDB3_9MARC